MLTESSLNAPTGRPESGVNSSVFGLGQRRTAEFSYDKGDHTQTSLSIVGGASIRNGVTRQSGQNFKKASGQQKRAPRRNQESRSYNFIHKFIPSKDDLVQNGLLADQSREA